MSENLLPSEVALMKGLRKRYMLTKKIYFCIFWFFSSFSVFSADLYITKSVERVPSTLTLEDGTIVSLPIDTADTTQGDLVFITDGIETTRIRIDTVPKQNQPYFKRLQGQVQQALNAKSNGNLNYFQRIWQRDRLENLWAWPRYFKYGYEGFHFSKLRETSFLRSAHSLALSVGPPYLVLGGHLKMTQHSGNLYSNILSAYSGRFNSLGWGLSVSVPFFRYELRKHSLILPEYGWLEPRLDSLFENRSRGSVVSLYGQDPQNNAALENLEHRISLRLAHLQYTMILDSDYYSTILHELKVTEVPAGFLGEWDLGVMIANSKLYPTMGMSLFPFTFQFKNASSIPYRFKVVPSHVKFGYVNTKQFFLSWSLQFTWHNPGRTLSGGKF
jgi:hypothetical protein